MPLILPGNVGSATAATGFNVANSVRYNDGDSPKLNIDFGSDGVLNKWTFSIWFKRSTLGTAQRLFCVLDSGMDDYMKFDTADQLEWTFDHEDGSNRGILKTNRVFRDVSAWYHLVCRLDTTDGTAGDRMRMYINGVEETSFATDTNPSQNETGDVGRDNNHYIGTSGSSQYFDGYFAEVCMINNQSLAPTSFGEFDSDSGIWKPIDVSGLTAGTNGFYLDFEASGNLGNDAFGGTDWGETNLAATDQTTDTCTNNFATINPLDNYFAQATLTEGNTKVSTQASAEAMSTSTFAMTKGKWYFEVDNISGSGAMICGITPTPSFATSAHGKSGDVTPHTISYVESGKVQEGNGSGGQTDLATYASYGNGNIIGVYMDLDNMKAYLSKDGSLQSATGINLEPLASNGTGHYMFFVGDFNSGARVCEANFGNGFQSLSSAVTDDNGFGAFEYSPNITGDGAAKKFYSCCTKNLAEFG